MGARLGALRARVWQLAVALLPATGVGLPAAAQTLSAAPAANATRAWTCQYLVTTDDLWFARCYDPALLAEYDPIADRGRPVVWDVPLWGPPLSDERTMELVRAVLCSSTDRCGVRVMSPAISSASRGR